MGAYQESNSGATNQTRPPLTFGEKAVGLTFNPGGDPQVTAVKALYATIIDQLNDMRPVYDGKPNELSRLLAIAITEAQSAQMWAVKAITWK